MTWSKNAETEGEFANNWEFDWVSRTEDTVNSSSSTSTGIDVNSSSTDMFFLNGSAEDDDGAMATPFPLAQNLVEKIEDPEEIILRMPSREFIDALMGAVEYKDERG